MLTPLDRAKLTRGCVVLVDLDPTQGREIQKTRPCIIVSADLYNNCLPTILVVPVTSLKIGRTAEPHQILVPAGKGGLDVASVALPEQIRCVDKSRVKKVLGRLPPELLFELQQGCQMAIGAISLSR